MSVESLAIVLHHAPFQGRDKLILVGIANHDGDGGAWPSIRTLGKYGNCSEKSIKRSLQVLMDAGAIVRHVQKGGNMQTADWNRPNLYEVLVECPPKCDKTKYHRPVDKNVKPEEMLWSTGGQ